MSAETVIVEEGSRIQEVAGQEVVASYGNDAAARDAYQQGAALVNRSHWGLIRVTGSTRASYLHNQTTANFKRLQPGEGTDTVFLTSTARSIDLVTALVTPEEIWLLTSPERREILLDWMPRFVFFMDDVQFEDASEQFAIFSLLGQRSEAVLTSTGASDLPKERNDHLLAELTGADEVRIVKGGGLQGEGYTLIVTQAEARSLWSALREVGAVPMGEEVWESLRVEQGRPAADRELTEEHNPLEAGLWEAVSFSKGCYIGQEIIARLDTYQKLKQQLWGVRLGEAVQPGTPVRVEGREVGEITSVTMTPDGPFALAYVRTKAGGEGLEVQVGETTGFLVDLPYITRARNDL